MRSVAAVGVFLTLSFAAQTLPCHALLGQEISAIANWQAPLAWKLDSGLAEESPASELETLGAAAVPTSLLPFVGISPCRLADTRGNGFTGQYGPPSVTGSGRTLTVVGQCGIPVGAQAVSFNFTAANVSAAGFLVAYPAGGAFPPVATMAYNQSTPNLSNAGVVSLGTGGAITIVAGATNVDVIVDVNGYYGPDLDSVCVNEGQASSITSSMIVDGTIVNADINASAAIADTKLATITALGKVADSALSANVTKLGQTIEASEITNVTRTVSFPLSSFINCQSSTYTRLSFVDAVDALPHLDSNGEGYGTSLRFDATIGSPDQNSEVCNDLTVPADYESGGAFTVRALKQTNSGDGEFLKCAVHVDNSKLLASSLVEVTSSFGTATTYTCTPTMTIFPGQALGFQLSITSPGIMNESVFVLSVAFEYTASQ